MNRAVQQSPEWHDVDEAVFRNDIVTAYRPTVLRGLVRHWPAVRHAIESPESIGRYLNGFDSGKPVDVLLAPPHVKGRIFYNANMSGFNFTRERQSISAVNDKLLRYSAFQNRPSLAVQSALRAAQAAAARAPRGREGDFRLLHIQRRRGPCPHIPEHRRGVLGTMSPQLTRELKAFLAKQLQR